MTLVRDVVRFGDYLPISEKWYSKIPQIMEMPNLIKVQLDSYEWFLREGLRELLDEISPIQDFTGSKMELRFGEYSFGEPKYDERECRERDATFAAPLRVKVELIVKETGEVKEQELFMGDFPLMTPPAPSSSTAPSASSYLNWCARPASTSPKRRTRPRAVTSPTRR